jgi:hypothetical protein
MAEATLSLSPNLDLEHALRLVRAAGYRVTKPKRKLTSRGPRCVVRFADGTLCRMTTHCRDDALDFERGIRAVQSSVEYAAQPADGASSASGIGALRT